MNFSKKLCRLISLFCAAAILLGTLGSVLVMVTSAAETRYTGYPTKMVLGEKIPQDQFYDENGNAKKINITEGQYTLVTYWASWCSDCQHEFDLLPTLKPVLSEYDNVQWYLIDYVDGKKETKQDGVDFIKAQQPGLPVLYDHDAKSFQSLGIIQIPTTLLLNPEGEIIYCYPDVIETKDHLRAILDYATKGADAQTLSYVQSNLLKADGTVKKAATVSNTSSTAQSFLAQYAVNSLNKSLLDTQKQWVDTNGSTGDLGDDLRLLQAMSAWKGYETQAMTLRQAVLSKVKDSNFTGEVALSDLNLSAIALLGDEKLSANALSLIQKGYLGAEFPLYCTSYNTDKQSYKKTVIDTTESLMTVYHLAQQGKVKKATLEWLKETMNTTGIYAKYNADGTAIQRYSYETPSVYALTALIGLETGDQELFTDALIQMEQCRTFDAASAANGSFSSKASDQALEQCLPLYVYSVMEQKGI